MFCVTLCIEIFYKFWMNFNFKGSTQSPKFWGRWVGARDYPANPLTPAAKIYLIGYPADKFWRPAVTQRKRINNIEKCPLKTAGLTWLHGVTASSQRFRWVDIHNFLQTTQQIRWTQQFRWLERERMREREREKFKITLYRTVFVNVCKK